MIDLNKLKADHDRYKKALENILDGDSPRTLAEAALNPPPPPPPPPPPVTLENLLAALKKFSVGRPLTYIALYNGESGTIEQSGATRIFEFYSLQEAYNFLTNEN